jgi:WD40 repeat protein
LEDGRLCVWRLGSRDVCVGYIPSACPDHSCANALCALGDYIFVGHNSGDLAVWNGTLNGIGDHSSLQVYLPVQHRAITPVNPHCGEIRALQSLLTPYNPKVNRSKALLFSLSSDRTIGIWDATPYHSLPPKNIFSLRLIDTLIEPLSLSLSTMAVEWTDEGHGDGQSGLPSGHYTNSPIAEWIRLYTSSGVYCGNGSDDYLIHIFTSNEMEMGGEVFRHTGSLRGHRQPVESLLVLDASIGWFRDREEFSEKVKRKSYLLSSSGDHTIRLWDTFHNTQIVCLSMNISFHSLVQSGEILVGATAENTETKDRDLFVHSISFAQYPPQISSVDRVTSVNNDGIITCLSTWKGCLLSGGLNGTVKEIYL